MQIRLDVKLIKKHINDEPENFHKIKKQTNKKPFANYLHVQKANFYNYLIKVNSYSVKMFATKFMWQKKQPRWWSLFHCNIEALRVKSYFRYYSAWKVLKNILIYFSWLCSLCVCTLVCFCILGLQLVCCFFVVFNHWFCALSASMCFLWESFLQVFAKFS